MQDLATEERQKKVSRSQPLNDVWWMVIGVLVGTGMIWLAIVSLGKLIVAMRAIK